MPARVPPHTPSEPSARRPQSFFRHRDNSSNRPLLVIGGAEVAADEPTHPGCVADVYRLIERVVATDLLHEQGIGALAQHRARRVAQAHRGECEDQQADADQHGHQRQDSPGHRLDQLTQS